MSSNSDEVREVQNGWEPESTDSKRRSSEGVLEAVPFYPPPKKSTRAKSKGRAKGSKRPVPPVVPIPPVALVPPPIPPPQPAVLVTEAPAPPAAPVPPPEAGHWRRECALPIQQQRPPQLPPPRPPYQQQRVKLSSVIPKAPPQQQRQSGRPPRRRQQQRQRGETTGGAAQQRISACPVHRSSMYRGPGGRLGTLGLQVASPTGSGPLLFRTGVEPDPIIGQVE
ncbi:formin-like protein 3 [Magnolia sinica]|uniref:formin-like protein 3 n=1 Tax=Magnolia sinica TaxID=86752 RepID=UPI0026589672|nr:formin-like protein 3 [Magnolia sinica]